MGDDNDKSAEKHQDKSKDKHEEDPKDNPQGKRAKTSHTKMR